MQYKQLVETYEKLDSTTKRLEKTFYIAKLLKKTPSEDLEEVILLLQGRVFPAYDPREIGFAARTLIKAINVAAGISNEDVEKEWRKTGDLGEATKNLVGKKTQATLFNKDLTLKKVFNNIQKMATLEGSGTVDRKVKLTAQLLTSAKPEEAKYIARTLLEDLRIGAAGGTLRDAIVWAFLPKVIGITPIKVDDTKKKFKDLIQETHDKH